MIISSFRTTQVKQYLSVDLTVVADADRKYLCKYEKIPLNMPINQYFDP